MEPARTIRAVPLRSRNSAEERVVAEATIGTFPWTRPKMIMI
jgi:hypothetical protein